MRSSFQSRLTIGLALLFILIIYWIFHAPVISFGDCVAWVYDAYFGVKVPYYTVHAHYLYNHLYVILTHLFGKSNVVIIGNLISIFSSLFSLWMLYKISRLFTSKTWLILSGIFLFGFSFSFWRNTEIIEVYTFNLAILSIFFYYSVKFLKTEQIVYYWFSLFILFISFLVHIQNILFLPYVGLILIFHVNNKKWQSFIILIALGLSFLLPALLIDEFNIREIFLPRKELIVEKTTNKSVLGYLKKIAIATGYFGYNFFFFSILIIYGAYLLFKKNIRLFLAFMVAIVPTLFFATFFDVSDNYTYFIPAYYLLVLVYLKGFSDLKDLSIGQQTMLKWMPLSHIFLYWVFFNLFLIIPNSNIKQFAENKNYKGGLEYYLWPGMQNAKSVVEFCDSIEKSGMEAENFHEFEFMYPYSLKLSEEGIK